MTSEAVDRAVEALCADTAYQAGCAFGVPQHARANHDHRVAAIVLDAVDYDGVAGAVPHIAGAALDRKRRDGEQGEPT